MLVGLPGAFTPVCSSNHIPAYVKELASLIQNGVDTIAVVSVNDAYVMAYWARELHALSDKFVRAVVYSSLMCL